MGEASAFAPCHVSGMFQICDESKDNLHNGSRGAGVSLNLGVTTVVKAEKGRGPFVSISINNRVTDSAYVSNRVAETFLSHMKQASDLRLIIEHHIGTPIGAGFGTSGAAALSLALALNKAFGLEMNKTEAAQIAHIAEVECKTGLGTVIAETLGGFEIRSRAGAPGIGEITRLPIAEDALVACRVFGPLSTSKYLADQETRTRINSVGGKLIEELVTRPTLINFMKLSRQFAERIGLITERVRHILRETDEAGIVCSMPMFGESAFTIADKIAVDEVLQIFDNCGLGGKTIVSRVNQTGARLLS